jgi:hypothetical protein
MRAPVCAYIGTLSAGVDACSHPQRTPTFPATGRAGARGVIARPREGVLLKTVMYGARLGAFGPMAPDPYVTTPEVVLATGVAADQDRAALSLSSLALARRAELTQREISGATVGLAKQLVACLFLGARQSQIEECRQSVTY